MEAPAAADMAVDGTVDWGNICSDAFQQFWTVLTDGLDIFNLEKTRTVFAFVNANIVDASLLSLATAVAKNLGLLLGQFWNTCDWFKGSLSKNSKKFEWPVNLPEYDEDSERRVAKTLDIITTFCRSNAFDMIADGDLKEKLILGVGASSYFPALRIGRARRDLLELLKQKSSEVGVAKKKVLLSWSTQVR